MKRTFYVGCNDSELVSEIESVIDLDHFDFDCLSTYMHAIDNLDDVVEATKFTIQGDGRRIKALANYLIRSYGRFCDEEFRKHLF